MTQKRYTEIPKRQKCINKEEPYIGGAKDIIDDELNKPQSQVNEETNQRVSTLEESVGTGGSVDERIAEEGAKHYLKTETYSKTELNNMITTPNQEYVTVTATDQTTAATDVLPATGEADTVYRVGNWDGSQYDESLYTEYAWNGSAYVSLSVKSQIGEVYDISLNHAGATYADLAAALGTNGANIPQSLRKGGMSVKFVQSSDNNYVQYIYMRTSTAVADFTNISNWQMVVVDKMINGSILYSGTITVPANTTRVDLPGNRIIGITVGTGDVDAFVQSVNFNMTRLVIRNSQNENILDVSGDFSKGIKLTIPEAQFYYIIFCGASSSERSFVLNISSAKIREDITDLQNRVDSLEENVTDIHSSINTINDNITHHVAFDESYNVAAGTYRQDFNVPNELKTISAPRRVIATGLSDGYRKVNRIVIYNNVSTILFDSQSLGNVDFSQGVSFDFPVGATWGYVLYGSNTHLLDEAQTIRLIIETSNEIYDTIKEVDNMTAPTIKNLNPEYYKYMRNIALGSKWMSTENNKPLVLAHISDIHADDEHLKRLVDFCKEYVGTFIHDIIHTGDSMENSYDDVSGFSFWEECGAEKVLNLIGNHDSVDANGQYTHNGLDAYNRFIKPYVSGWNVTQPEGADELGPCYYYKDYITTNQKVRLVILNTTGDAFDSTQQTWLTSVLASARENSFHVVIANHFVPDECDRFDSPFCTRAAFIGNLTLSSLTTIVKNFIDAGGKFVCHLVGHLHKDFLGKISSDTRQLVVGISKGGVNTRNGWEDGYRANGEKSGDCLNLFAVDCDRKIVKIARIGFDMDSDMRKKTTVVVNYNISQSHPEPTII